MPIKDICFGLALWAGRSVRRQLDDFSRAPDAAARMITRIEGKCLRCGSGVHQILCGREVGSVGLGHSRTSGQGGIIPKMIVTRMMSLEYRSNTLLSGTGNRDAAPDFQVDMMMPTGQNALCAKRTTTRL